MAETISPAVLQESVSQILTGLLHKYEGKGKSNANENLERLEMAHIKLDAAVEISNRWVISDPPLLRWRQKLKLAAQECDDTLKRYNQRILEEEQMDQEVRTSSFPKRVAHATKTFLFSAFSNNDDLSRSIIRRFEWFADGASDFLRFIELGGAPRCQMPFHSLVKHLLAGKELYHKIVARNGCRLSMLPFKTAELGMEASLIFIQKDGNAPENNFFLSVILQLSESTDIISTTIKCLQLYTPHFKSTIEIIKKELTQLPTQDFSWVPYVDSCHKEHWDNLHSLSTQWFRPNPLCCKRHDQQNLCCGSRLETLGAVPDVSLEPVIEVNLQCQVSLSEYNKRRTPPYLKVGLLFTPHGSSEDMLFAEKSSPLTEIYAEEQHCLHTNIGLGQLGETMLSKATDHFHRNTEAIVYQMLWMSKHGTAYVQVEKATMATQRTFGGARKRKLVQQQDTEIGAWIPAISHFLNLWAAHVPLRLQGLVADWIQKEKEKSVGSNTATPGTLNHVTWIDEGSMHE